MLDEHMAWYRSKCIKTEYRMGIMDKCIGSGFVA